MNRITDLLQPYFEAAHSVIEKQQEQEEEETVDTARLGRKTTYYWEATNGMKLHFVAGEINRLEDE